MGTFTDDTFDPATWDEMLELFGREGVAEMLAAMGRDLPQQRQNLDAALLAGDRATVKRVAHGLRGAALQFGATGLAEHCGGIERAIAADSPLEAIAADAAAMVERHVALVRRLDEALRDR